ncbi:hypothetical protein [Escherichia phage M01]|nr:hypothetical protein [Escherichia phage M01]
MLETILSITGTFRSCARNYCSEQCADRTAEAIRRSGARNCNNRDLLLRKTTKEIPVEGEDTVDTQPAEEESRNASSVKLK